MKFKPIYLYGIVILIAVVTVIILTQFSDQEKVSENIVNKKMPDDNIHKKLGHGMMQNPAGGMVTEEVKQKLASMKKNLEKNPDDTLMIREYADLLITANQPSEAHEYYEKIIAKDKSRKDIYFTITYIYYHQRNFQKAEQLTREMYSLFPDDPMVCYNLGASEIRKGNKEKAKEIWNKLIKDHPTDTISVLAKRSLERL
ncbi:MAG: tetratricopeptide repeat protein [Ignavibacterium sp.]|nr:MAG: tetratricopeptide repeat protein [Ignavibacterium sp.]